MRNVLALPALIGLVAPAHALDMRFYNSVGGRPGVTDGTPRRQGVPRRGDRRRPDVPR